MMPERPAGPAPSCGSGSRVALSGTGRAGGRPLAWRKAEAEAFGQDLESMGGAIAEPPRANRTAQAA